MSSHNSITRNSCYNYNYRGRGLLVDNGGVTAERSPLARASLLKRMVKVVQIHLIYRFSAIKPFSLSALWPSGVVEYSTNRFSTPVG